jgi:hypothetical protein
MPSSIRSGPVSVVGIATGYGLDGPGIDSRGDEVFRTCLNGFWYPPRLLYNGYPVFPGGKERPRSDADPSPLSRAVGHEILYSSYGPYGLYRASVPVQGCTLPFFFFTSIRTFSEAQLIFSSIVDFVAVSSLQSKGDTIVRLTL